MCEIQKNKNGTYVTIVKMKICDDELMIAQIAFDTIICEYQGNYILVDVKMNNIISVYKRLGKYDGE